MKNLIFTGALLASFNVFALDIVQNSSACSELGYGVLSKLGPSFKLKPLSITTDQCILEIGSSVNLNQISFSKNQKTKKIQYDQIINKINSASVQVENIIIDEINSNQKFKNLGITKSLAINIVKIDKKDSAFINPQYDFVSIYDNESGKFQSIDFSVTPIEDSVEESLVNSDKVTRLVEKAPEKPKRTILDYFNKIFDVNEFKVPDELKHKVSDEGVACGYIAGVINGIKPDSSSAKPSIENGVCVLSRNIDSKISVYSNNAEGKRLTKRAGYKLWFEQQMALIDWFQKVDNVIYEHIIEKGSVKFPKMKFVNRYNVSFLPKNMNTFAMVPDSIAVQYEYSEEEGKFIRVDTSTEE